MGGQGSSMARIKKKKKPAKDISEWLKEQRKKEYEEIQKGKKK